MITSEKNAEGAVRTVPDDQSVDLALGDRLRQALMGENRSRVIAVSGVSDRTVTKVLSGHRPRQSTLASLADAIGVRKEWLIDGTGEMREETVSIAIQAKSYPRPPSRDDAHLAQVTAIIEAGSRLADSGLRKSVDLPRMALAMKTMEQAAKTAPNPPAPDNYLVRAENLMICYDFIGAFGPDIIWRILELDPPKPDAPGQA